MSGVIAWMFRIFSYFYHLGVALFLFGLGLVAQLSGDDHTLDFVLLPWEGNPQIYLLLGLGLLGTVAAALAMMGKTRVLLMLTALIFFFFLLRGLFFSRFRFDSGLLSWQSAQYLLAAAVIALIGAFWNPGESRRRI